MLPNLICSPLPCCAACTHDLFVFVVCLHQVLFRISLTQTVSSPGGKLDHFTLTTLQLCALWTYCHTRCTAGHSNRICYLLNAHFHLQPATHKNTQVYYTCFSLVGPYLSCSVAVCFDHRTSSDSKSRKYMAKHTQLSTKFLSWWIAEGGF